jgi:cell division septation protein DedD
MATATQDDGFHEIQLNGKQLVFLFMAGTVVAVVIFLLGVFVGRGVRAEVGDTSPVTAQELPAPAPDVPPVAAATPTGTPATAKEDIEYPQRLNGGPAPAERLRDTNAPAPASSTRTPALAEETRAAVTPAPAPTAPVSTPPAADIPSEPAGDGFAIQVAALAKRDEAETVVRRLTGKGYSAYVIAPASGAPAVFRVRVGKFKERREAESVSARLQKEEQFKPWIVR